MFIFKKFLFYLFQNPISGRNQKINSQFLKLFQNAMLRKDAHVRCVVAEVRA